MVNVLDGLDLGGQKGTNAADPVSSSDLATMGWVQANTAVAPTRATATATTASLAPGAADSSTTVTLGKGYVLYSIQTSRPARVELYETAAAMAADATRAAGVDPLSSAGVVLDYVTPAGATTYPLGPLVHGANLEAVPISTISMRVTNNDSSTGTVVVTFVWLKVE